MSPEAVVVVKVPEAPKQDPRITRIKVTAQGALTADFKGKIYTSDGEDYKGSPEDLMVLDANPKFVVERFDKEGFLLKRTGERYKGVPAPRPIPKHKDDDEKAGM